MREETIVPLIVDIMFVWQPFCNISEHHTQFILTHYLSTQVEAGPRSDLALLSSCHDTIMDYGNYGVWGAVLAGGEVIIPQSSGVCTNTSDQGSVLAHLGSVLTHQGSVLTHQGSVLMQQGSVLTHQGSVLMQQGSVLTHQGSVLTHQGSVQTHQGYVLTHQGSVLTHQIRGLLYHNKGI